LGEGLNATRRSRTFLAERATGTAATITAVVIRHPADVGQASEHELTKNSPPAVGIYVFIDDQSIASSAAMYVYNIWGRAIAY